MEDADSGTQRARVLRVATRCTSPEQFVEAFARFCEGRTLFVSSLSTRPIGTRLPFVILLADGTRAMRGQCEVIESYANPGNVYRRPGVKLSMVDLDDDSEAMLGRLQEARRLRDARTAAAPPAMSGGLVMPPELRARQQSRSGPRVPRPPTNRPVAEVPPRATGGRLPALPALPRLPSEPGQPRREPPATEPHWLAPQPATARRAPLAPPPDPTDDGWGDDDAGARPRRASTAPPVARRAPTEPPVARRAPTEPPVARRAPTAPPVPPVAANEDSTPALIVSRASGRHSVVRPTPGDVYSPEERTPGSSFILPANPLADLTDEALQGFVDLTLYEDASSAAALSVPSDPAISGSQLGMVEEPPEDDDRPYAPAASEPPVVARSRSVHMSGELQVPVVPAAAEPIELVQRRAPTQPPPLPVSDDDDFLPPVVAAPASEPARRPAKPTPPPPLPVPSREARPATSRPDWLAPAPAPTADEAARPPRPRTVAEPRVRRRRWLLPAVLLAAVAVAAVVLFLRWREREREGREPAGGVVATRDAGVATVVDAAVALAPADAAVAEAAVDAAVAAVAVDAAAGGGTCRLQVTTQPAGAAITFDGESLGNAPVDRAVPCGAGTVSARLARYLPASRQVRLTAGDSEVVGLKLARPMHDLTVLSTPIRATVKVGGRVVGRTPLTTKVAGFTRHTVTIELEGYQTYRATVQADDKEQTVAAPLVPLP